MSLINDALKRAGQAPKQPDNAVPERPMQPVEQPHSSATPAILSVVLAVVLIGAGLFFWKWQNSARSTVSESTSAEVELAPALKDKPVIQPTTTPAPESAALASPAVAASATPVASEPPATVIGPVTAPTPVTATVSTGAAMAESATVATNVAVEVPAVPTFPELKLQGILFNPANPTAMINGRTLSVGSKTKGVRVVKIESNAVTVEWNGEQRVLELEE